MPPPGATQGLCEFPGIAQVIRAEYTLQHGITPGVCHLECVPQLTPIAAGGTLRFKFGGVLLEFPGCRVDQGSYRANSSGQIVSLAIFDRRWKWRFGAISGEYNARQADNTIKAGREKTPQELAILCLKAMGEPAYDVSQLPNDSRPHIAWDHEVPAQALAQLAEDLGCRVVLRLDNSVMIARTGFGEQLPIGGMPITEAGQTVDTPERPDRLRIVCAPSVYQIDIPLEAVGLDTDGRLKIVDELSYTPASGWGSQDSMFFSGVAAGAARELAKQTVWRWYRILAQNLDGSIPLVIPGYGPITHRDLLLPLGTSQVEQYADAGANGDELKAKPAEVYGTYYDGALAYANTMTTFGDIPGRYYTGGFAIDAQLGLVKFGDAVYQLDADGNQVDAAIYLRTGVTVRDPITLAFERYSRDLVYPGGQWGTGPRAYKHDELEYQTITHYDANGYVAWAEHNETRLLQECDYYLAAANLEYQATQAISITYAGLVPINPDGAIQSVSWSVGGGPATTRAGRNNEFNPAIPPYRLRRQWEQARAAELQHFRGRLKQIQAARSQLAADYGVNDWRKI